MRFDSDDDLVEHVRSRVGVSTTRDLPRDDIHEELEAAKSVLSKEIEEQLRKSGRLNFYDNEAAQECLEEYMYIRASARKERNVGNPGQGPDRRPEVANAPSSVSALRRHDFGDQTLNHARQRMVRHLNRVTDD